MRLRRLAVPAATLIFWAMVLHGQGSEVVVHQRPIHVRHFAGKIVDVKGMTVEYATVELHDLKTHRLLASTFADGKGYFAFDDKKYGKRIELRVIQKGFDVAVYTVMLKPFGDQQIRLVITVAT